MDKQASNKNVDIQSSAHTHFSKFMKMGNIYEVDPYRSIN